MDYLWMILIQHLDCRFILKMIDSAIWKSQSVKTKPSVSLGFVTVILLSLAPVWVSPFLLEEAHPEFVRSQPAQGVGSCFAPLLCQDIQAIPHQPCQKYPGEGAGS